MRSPECARGEHELCRGEYEENGQTLICLCPKCRHDISKPMETTPERVATGGIYAPEGWIAPPSRTEGPPRRGY